MVVLLGHRHDLRTKNSIGSEAPMGSRLEGQGNQEWITKRVVMVTAKNIKLIAVYQPVSHNEEAIDEYRKTMNTAIAAKRDEMLLIGGDHNAPIGRQEHTGRDTTIGKFGLPTSQPPEVKS